MQNATVDRLVKLITEPEPSEESKQKKRTPGFRGILSHLHLAEGWSSFFLLALVVYSPIWSVQSVSWVEHLDRLTLIPALGLIFGVIAAKQRRIPRLLTHVLATVLGLSIAFWQTCSAYYAGQISTFLDNIYAWLLLAVNGGTSNDASIFLFLILALGFLLAYTSTWLVYRTRSPWLMLLANAVILLINLSYIDPSHLPFLMIFLIAAFFFLLRFNLYESSLHWQQLGLRCSENLRWQFMQVGAWISLAVLLFSWLLPWGYINQQAAQIWSADNNPWVQAQNAWNRLLAVNNGTILPNHGNFTNTLTLSGNPNLTNDPVFQVKTTDGSQYLISVSYDQYDGIKNWSNSPQGQVTNQANAAINDGSAYLYPVTQTIKVVNPPGEQYPYLFGASQIGSSNQHTHLEVNKSDDEIVAWLRDKGKLTTGDIYTVVSYVSQADVQSLRSVPMPAASPKLSPNYDGQLPLTYFDPHVLATYTKLPTHLDSQIQKLALQITRNVSTMYDKVSALENYLHNNYLYDSTIPAPPAGTEGTSWFLFHLKRSFCNYFASAMALMARELGIPARVAVGYTSGKFDSQTGIENIRGNDAHAWTQVYFAGYGWINFEPSASFSHFQRPLIAPSATPVGATTPTGTNNPIKKHLGPLSPLQNGASGANPSSTGSSDILGQIRMGLGVILFILIVFLLGALLYFNLWWRSLFQGLSLPSQIYGRVCLLANWAGIVPKRGQTPHEYMQELASVAPEEAATLERLGDIYARERWADPQSSDHPSRSKEIREIPSLWRSLQPRLLMYVLRRPHFLKHIPSKLRRPSFRRGFLAPARVVVEEEEEST
jgi:transglutaminase-like putative cysteine protease